MRPLRILTWHVHGNYLWYLSHVPHEIVLPVRPGRPHGYGGRSGAFPWPATVREVPADRTAEVDVDVGGLPPERLQHVLYRYVLPNSWAPAAAFCLRADS